MYGYVSLFLRRGVVTRDSFTPVTASYVKDLFYLSGCAKALFCCLYNSDEQQS